MAPPPSLALRGGGNVMCGGAKGALETDDKKEEKNGVVIPPYTILSLDTQARFLSLESGQTSQAEYIWIGGGGELRCKTKSLPKGVPATIDELPVWNFDGSSTEQAPGTDSEVLLKPCAMYKDPFRPTGSNILVLCDCYKPDPDAPEGIGEAIPTNTRKACNEIMTKVAAHEPWFGIEQE